MKITEYKKYFLEKLTPIYDAVEAESFFHLALEHFNNLKRIDLALNPELVFSDEEVKRWDLLVENLTKEIPIQYLLGVSHFYGLEFSVDENVLIPRPETEELVEWVISENRGKTDLKILDIGTGSGCIAIALAKNIPDAKVSAIDVSEKALEISKENAAANNVAVSFIKKNILETENLGQQFDLIVSNPPYVRNLEKHEIRKNVLDNEPHLALFVDDNDALLFYKKIADLALKNLAPGGKLFFEINQYLAKETMDMLEAKGFGFMELRKDIYGNDRMILAKI